MSTAPIASLALAAVTPEPIDVAVQAYVPLTINDIPSPAHSIFRIPPVGKRPNVGWYTVEYLITPRPSNPEALRFAIASAVVPSLRPMLEGMQDAPLLIDEAGLAIRPAVEIMQQRGRRHQLQATTNPGNRGSGQQGSASTRGSRGIPMVARLTFQENGPLAIAATNRLSTFRIRLPGDELQYVLSQPRLGPCFSRRLVSISIQPFSTTRVDPYPYSPLQYQLAISHALSQISDNNSWKGDVRFVGAWQHAQQWSDGAIVRQAMVTLTVRLPREPAALSLPGFVNLEGIRPPFSNYQLDTLSWVRLRYADNPRFCTSCLVTVHPEGEPCPQRACRRCGHRSHDTSECNIRRGAAPNRSRAVFEMATYNIPGNVLRRST